MRLAERRLRRRSRKIRHGSSDSKLGYVPVECKLMNGKYCAACCFETEMPLTEEDIARLEALGYQLSEFAIRGSDGIYRLRNVDGRCFFLDPATRVCTVYDARPEGCRLYPLVYDPSLGRVVIDPDCPRAHTVPQNIVDKLSERVVELIRKIYGDVPKEST